ncbi:MAG: hypothetical protein K2Y56_06210 [Methylobacterium sp.]|uniref:hypothetical protein n=1 Tax=Methylobacterium sp. TaxID=409 RepID=UPI0025F456E1|nr:hypothetical protein [Methylobacterium sp.]MBX9931117.1 hypothetical protein [Methylobacterium sp.]
MAASTEGLSDKALSILIFAAYYRLVSGQRVATVVRRDGHGHEADAEGLAELEQRGLASATADQIALKPEAEDFLDALIVSLHRQVGR